MSFKTAELRRWSRKGFEIEGHVYNDPTDSWEDGERGNFQATKENFFDQGQYYLLVHGHLTFKLMKDEEVVR